MRKPLRFTQQKRTIPWFYIFYARETVRENEIDSNRNLADYNA